MKNLSGSLQRYLQWPITAWTAVLLAGALTPLAFAPYRWYWLMPILFGVLVLFAGVQEKRAVWLAYLWGFAAYLTQNYWVNISLHDVAALPQVYALPMTLLFPAYLALYPALCFWLLEKLHIGKGLRLAVALPALWTLSEYVREIALTGFGWGALGYSQIAASPLAGFAPVGGIHLVTLSVAAVGAWAVLALLTASFRQRVAAVAACVLVFALGAHLQSIEFTTPDGSEARVALIQGNVPQTLKFDPERIGADIQMYYDRVAQLHDADIAILPESAIPVIRQTLPEGVLAQFASTAKRHNVALAMGIIQYTPQQDGYENAVINLAEFNPEHPDSVPYYAKNHLVPFGEFRPFPVLTGWLYNLMNMPLSDFSRGGTQQAPLQLANQKVAFNICYEDSFGSELIDSAAQASMLANVSNMGWFGSSEAMNLQLQHSQARAMELGRYMVRATNNGVSAVIAPNGKITAMIARDTRDTLYATAYGYSGSTPYMRLGGNLPLMVLLSLIVLALFAFSRRHKLGLKQ
ncbi:MAG: apolipoprotein N-acyltransferase [Neisseria sp.]|nr:apolipoprotein N-acyltransferase [Neisseria sp.]